MRRGEDDRRTSDVGIMRPVPAGPTHICNCIAPTSEAAPFRRACSAQRVLRACPVQLQASFTLNTTTPTQNNNKGFFPPARLCERRSVPERAL